jgi:SPP1 family phage portal protein
MTGRRIIYTDVDEINDSNVVEVLKKAMETHTVNSNEIQYLYNYYKGNQPILTRTKDIRPEICNRIVENRANEIVSFKTSYLIGKPIQYVNRSGDDGCSEDLNKFNEFMFLARKSARDKALVDWFTIAGTAYRLILPDKNGLKFDESPFKLYTLDPRYSFVVYHSGLGNKRVMGGTYIVKADNTVVYSVYTDNMYYEIVDDKITKSEGHTLGRVPIIEYPLNSARLGAFEIVLSLLDAINEVASNRLDGIEQFIQAIMVLKGVDIDSEEFKKIKELGGLKIPSDGAVDYLVQELNQGHTQTVVDDLYQSVLTICGMPNRNGGSSTSDTGSAVIMRDGWSDAEARAQSTEDMFKESESEFLLLAIYIYNTFCNRDLKPSAVETRFTRRNYENIQAKSQVLTTMLSNNKIHPRLAFEYCGMFIDPELAYTESMAYNEEQQAKAVSMVDNTVDDTEDKEDDE